VARPAQSAPQQATAVAPVVFDTDAFLSELERALGGPRTPELMALDVLTPHAREVVLDSR
jgi:NAD(P)H-hydrate repair Nnr-like enzyme with NAD(P)H-hydrate dehydratase domain